MKAPKAWPQVIENPLTPPDEGTAVRAATKLEPVARAPEPTSSDDAGGERQTDMTNTTSEEALLATLKRAPSPLAPVIQEKEPVLGSLDAGWEDPPEEAAGPAEAKTAPPPSSEGAKTAPPPSNAMKTAPPPASYVAKTAPPPGMPTPLLPGPIIGPDGIARLSDPDDDGIEEPTKVGDSLVESMRGGRIAKLADDDDDLDAESSKEGLTVIGNSLIQSGMIDAPDVAALTAMRPSDEPKAAVAADAAPAVAADAAPAVAADAAPAVAKTTDELPKLGDADESGQNPSAPPLQSLAVAPASKPEGEPRAQSEPVAAVARPAWTTSRYAIVALLLALATLLVAMRVFRH